MTSRYCSMSSPMFSSALPSSAAGTTRSSATLPKRFLRVSLSVAGDMASVQHSDHVRRVGRPRPDSRRDLDKAVGPRQRAVAHRVDGKLMHGEADMQRRVGIEIGILAREADRVRRIHGVAADLADHQFAEIRAAPVRRGDQVLRGGDRLQPAAKAHQEAVDRSRIVPGLAGDALDDGKQVLGAVADLTQQRLQRLLAAPLLGGLDDRDDDALDLAAIGRCRRRSRPRTSASRRGRRQC